MENNHHIEHRPWGSYEILSEFKVDEPGFRDSCIKILRLKPGASLSYQSHKQRNEHWFVVQGIGKVVLNDKEVPIQVGSSIDIKIGDKHRAINTSDHQELIIVESQTGHYDEQDIERFEDEYGRA
jgi:mannose-6-phosphate isomerase-like protein (cupin superfamily)